MNKTPIYLISLAILISAWKKKDDNADALINLNKNLVLYYPLNGDAIDAGPNHINGKLKNGLVATTNHLGVANSAILFHGDDDFIQVDSSFILNNLVRPFTFSAWVRIDDWYVTSQQFAPIYCKSGIPNDSIQYRLMFSRNNSLYWFAPNSCGGVSAGYFPNLNNWFNITIVEDINNIEVYANGQLSKIYSCPDQVLQNNSQLLIGIDPEGVTEYFNGAMDEFRLFNKALSPEEVLLIQ